MKLRSKIIAMLLVGVFALSGCGAKTESGDTKEIEALNVTAEMAKEYVTLGDYKGLELIKYVTPVTDEDVEYAKESFMEDYRVEADVTDRGIEVGDYVNVNMKETPEGSETIDYEDVDFHVGDAELSEEIDNALLGHKAGETVTAEGSYEEEGETVKVTDVLEIQRVYQVIYPEYNDQFVKENTQYSTVAELDASFETQVKEENDMTSMDNLRESALSEVIAISEFKELSQEIVDASYDEMKATYEGYADMFGMSLEEIVSEEELQSLAEWNAQEKLVIQAIISAENIQKTDENYSAFKQEYMKYMDVETEEELMEYCTEDELEESFYRQMALDVVISNATITEEEETAEDSEEAEGEEESEGEDMTIEME